MTEIYTVDELVKLDDSLRNTYAPALLKTVQIGALCNNAVRNSEGSYVGQSTDVALMNVLDTLQIPSSKAVRTNDVFLDALFLDLMPFFQDFTMLGERPFNSELKTMAVSGKHTSESHEMYYVKGALEVILPRCRWHYISADVTPELDALTRSLIVSKAEAVSSRGLRVVGMAYGLGSVSMLEAEGTIGEQNLVFAGFQAMMDPPRKGISDSIASLHSGRIKVIMITGDAVETALAVARQLGILVQGKSVLGSYANGNSAGKGSFNSVGCLTGKEMDEMDDQMLCQRVGGITVFARTTPRHKMRIVSAFQSRGAVVAMTGDGGKFSPLVITIR